MTINYGNCNHFLSMQRLKNEIMNTNLKFFKVFLDSLNFMRNIIFHFYILMTFSHETRTQNSIVLILLSIKELLLNFASEYN